MNDKKNIKDSIEKLASKSKSFGYVAQVLEVHNASCKVRILLSGLELPNVRLNAQPDKTEGLILKPSVGSKVLIDCLSDTDYYVTMYSQLDSMQLMLDGQKLFIDKNGIVLNGNQAGSYLTDINRLVDELNKIRNEINTLKQIFTTWVPAPMDGGAVLKAASAAWAGQLMQPPVNVNSMKDGKVKH